LNKLLVATAVFIALNGCSQEPSQTESAAKVETAAPEKMTEKAPAKPELGEWGVDLSAMDKVTDVGADFNRFVNGSWMDKFEIPSDRARWGVFDQLRERSTEQVNAIITELSAKKAEPGSLEQKVGDYYATWMNVDAANTNGAAPLKTHLEAISKISDKSGLLKEMAGVHATAPFGIGIIPDPADTTKYTVIASQAGLGMPDRDYYLKDDEKFVKFREAYKAYMTKIQDLAGISEAAEKTEAIYAIEKQLADIHWSQADNRNIQKIYNPMSPEKLKEIAPEVDWDLVLETTGLKGVDNIVVLQPEVFTKTAKIIENTDIDTWKAYLAYHFIRGHAQYLSQDFDDANFTFFRKTLSGIEAQRERWKRGADLVNRNLGEAVGKIYIDRHFSPDAKKQMDELVENLRGALEERLHQNEWMDDETRKQALLKLSTFEPRIGYTEKWTDYSDLEINKGDLLGNALRVVEFQWKQQLDRLNGPVDRDIWPYPPQTVNASYNPLLNQITFPAGILQPPFFDAAADPAVNYGAIGAVIGHEIGHGFDDQGRRFDEKGLIRDWWTETADKQFKDRSSKLVEQYNGYSPIEGMHVNGELTLGENIGDLGGIQMAYAAYQRYKAKHGEPPVIDGYTGDQRFFLSFGQIWRGKMREDAIRQQLLTDPHSPSVYRINGVVRNVDAWYKAFDIKEDAPMYLPPEERVKIW